MHIKTFREMNYRRLGKSGLWLSEIGLGLWKWGAPAYDGSRVGGFQNRALERANSYNMGSGNSERLLGRYFQRRGAQVRDQVVLVATSRFAQVSAASGGGFAASPADRPH